MLDPSRAAGSKIPFVSGYGATETAPAATYVFWPTDRVGMSCVIDGGMAANDKVLHALPLYHCAQLDVFLGPQIYLGSSGVITGRPTADNVLALIQAHRITSFYGEEILTHEKHLTPQTPGWVGTVMKSYAMDAVHSFPGHAQFALELIRGLIEADVDVGAAAKVEDPQTAGFGHAYGFVIERLFRARAIPVVPVLLNTYYPPNAPTARRCYDIGLKLARIIEASPRKLRVAVAASGGLSHFVVDEQLDRKVLNAIRCKHPQVLRGLTRGELNSGSSEILNWVMTAAMSEHLTNDWSEYYPAYRTPAGTGTGIGFATWS
ncbi:hypothetical protein IVB05_26895 [Bradyrhizobium sp. 170]|nr:hypothetical protein IVB05_26895 [Bradyrhizobium sp. 170]